MKGAAPSFVALPISRNASGNVICAASDSEQKMNLNVMRSRRWRLHETAPPRRRRRGRQRVRASRECTDSAQVGDELKPGLIDFGQCTTLTKPQLRTVCQLVVLLRTRSQTLIDQALRGSGFGFNTEDPELKLALSYLRVLKC